MRENFPRTRTRTRTGLNDLKKKLTSTLTSYHWVKLIKWGNESNFHIFQSNLTSFLEVNSNRGKSFIISTYIKLAGNCGEFAEAMRAYQAAIESECADVVTYSSYIIAAGNCGQFDEAMRAYQAAIKSECVDVVTYSSYITAAGNCGQFAEAMGAYQAAIKSECANVVTYFSYITAAGNCGQFDEAMRAYQAAIKSECVDVVTYNSYITAAGNCGQFAEAMGAYQAAIKSECANVVTYSSYITAAGNCGQFDEAMRAYQAAIKSECVDVVTYNSYITAAGNCGEFDEAMRAYQAAIKSECANVVTYFSYITAAGNCGQFAEAMRAYQAAIDNGYTNVVTFNSYVDVMLRYNGELSFEERKSLLNEFINSLETRFENFSFREKKEVDLHGENYTSALINLLYLYYASECSKITVIHGLGSHSNDQSPVLCAFNQFIEMTGCKYFTHKNNRGASTLEIRNQKKPDKDFLINLMLEKLGTTDNPSSKTEYSVVPFSENRNPDTSEYPNGFFNGNSNQKQFNLNFHAKEWFPKNSWK